MRVFWVAGLFSMRDFSQTNGCKHPSTRRKSLLPLGGGGCWLWICVVAWGMLTASGLAQSMRLGPMDLFLQGTLEVAYESNVDDAYPEEQKENLQVGDFYWMPGLTLRSQSIPMFSHSTLSFGGGIAYQDYFVRSDSDTELYNAVIDINMVLPRLTLSGAASIDYSIDSDEDQYVPGGVSRDPTLTHAADAGVNWHWGKLRLESSASWSMERHDYSEYQIADQDEKVLFSGIYLDLFTWGSLFYSWEETLTTFVQKDEENDEIKRELGLTGGIPFDLIRRPKITYSLGFEYRDETANPQEFHGEWEPRHTILVADKFQLGKTVSLSGYVQWENIVYDDDIGFTYALLLEQLLGTRAKHSLSFVQEPRSTLGSTTDTETTTYAYNFSIEDLFIYNLLLRFGASYEESTPLGTTDGITENTTIFTFGLSHTRQINRQLSRILAYEYAWEDSNFHHDGAKESLLLTYGFSYDF